MICDCCDRNSRWARTSPDDVGWCSMCQTFQWRRDAPVRFYAEGGKPEKGHACVRCDEPWGTGLEFVWHPKCRCRVKGPLPTHALVKETPGKIARVECRCGWTGTGRYERYGEEEDEEYLDDDFRREIAMEHARSDFEDHKWRAEVRSCDCPVTVSPTASQFTLIGRIACPGSVRSPASTRLALDLGAHVNRGYGTLPS